MSGGIDDKRGNWYEEAYAVHQALRLLTEEVESVQWEGRGLEEGMDLWSREKGVLWCEQCKTRRGRHWTLASLGGGRDAGTSFLRYAYAQLTADSTRRVRFVSDARGPEFERLLEVARRSSDAATWTADEAVGPLLTDLLTAWSLPNDHAGRETALSLARRIDYEFAAVGILRKSSKTIAVLLAGDRADALLSELRAFLRGNLGVTLCADGVRDHLEQRGVRLEPRAEAPLVAVRLDQLAAEFTERVVRSRRLALIERPELVARIVGWFAASVDGATMLVHGPAGSGKSEILAAAVQRLRDASVPLLAVTPDRTEASLGLGADAMAALFRFAGGRSACLVIDQLDQALLGGSGAQSMIEAVSSLVRRARALRIRVLVGCRSIDAWHETQINHLLGGAEGKPDEVLPVAELSDVELDAALAQEGIVSAAISARN